MPFIIGIIAIMLTGCSIFLALIISTTKDVDNKNIEDAKKDGSSNEVAVVKKEIVPDEIAELFGVNPDDYDTDEDGLSNYIEIYITGTLPTLADTDEDGTTDADEDSDEDGLTNIEEVDLGTNLLKVDTDNDGIPDYDEVTDYETDPCQYDTDGDKLGDGDEIILGLDPLKKKTDGKTLDSEREFTQDLSENNIEEALISEESEAIPSLTLTASGNINRNVEIISTYSNDFSDSRAIVGKGIDIVGENISEGVLSFELKDSGIMHTLEDTGDRFPTALICKYNEDGTTEYLRTDFDEEESLLTAEIEGEGTYFVLDVKNLFDELGLEMPTVSEEEYEVSAETLSATTLGKSNQGAVATMLSYSEPVKTTSKKTKAKGSAAAMAQADIIFIIDTTGSMGNEISNVKNNINGFIDALKARGVSAALALIDYQDLDADGYDSTKIHKNGASNWFYDMDEYKAAISALSLGNGGDTEECAVDALETARLLDMRASAGKIFVLVTDADYKVLNRYEIPSMDFEIDLLKNAGVSCSVISSSYDKDTYENLYTQTNGIWADINGNFETELTMLADKIGDEIVGDGYWIYLYGPVPVPVRLDAEPEEGSDVDTDKDGIPDIEELESITPEKEIDLDELLTEVSRGVITGTNYGVVSMYKYKSSPVEQDSDFDGIGDWEDEKPCDNSFEATVYNSIPEGINVKYKMDYRYLINSEYPNTLYNQELSALGAVYATLAYKGTIKYNYGIETDKIQIDEVYKKFGLDNVIDYSLGDGIKISETEKFEAYHDDDISEVVVGHRKLEHGGKLHEIIIVSVRGTNGTIEEWSSNFDVGATCDDYWDKDNDDWDNHENHKGFDVAANRLSEFLDWYIGKYVEAGAEKSIYIVGHSRGAAIANILGSMYTTRTDFNTYAYGFATPNTTTVSNAESYRGIYSIVNNDDIVPKLPLTYWKFKKYGTVKSASVGDEYENTFLGEKEGDWEWLINANKTSDKLDYNKNGSVSMTVSQFEKVVKSRDELYSLPDDAEELEDYALILDEEYDTYDKAEDAAQKKYDSYSFRLKRACEIGVYEETNKITKKTNYKPAILQKPDFLNMNIAEMAVGNMGDGLGYNVAKKYASAKNGFIVTAADQAEGWKGDITTFLRIGGMGHGHWPETYYLLGRYHK